MINTLGGFKNGILMVYLTFYVWSKLFFFFRICAAEASTVEDYFLACLPTNLYTRVTFNNNHNNQ